MCDGPKSDRTYEAPPLSGAYHRCKSPGNFLLKPGVGPIEPAVVSDIADIVVKFACPKAAIPAAVVPLAQSTSPAR